MRLIVTAHNGMHGRVCDLFASRAKKIAGGVRVSYDGRTVDGKSIIGLMSLGVARGGEIEVSGGTAVLRRLPGFKLVGGGSLS